MNKLWDKFLLGLCCCAFMLAEGTDPSNITTLLLAVICSAIFQINQVLPLHTFQLLRTAHFAFSVKKL